MTATPDSDLIPDFFGNIWGVHIHSTGPTIVIKTLVRSVEADEDDDAPTWHALTPEHAVQLAHKILECAAWAENLRLPDTEGGEKGNQK